MDTIKIIIELMGGLGLFLYGMKLMGDGLENAAGENLKIILEKLTSNRLMGLTVGALVTAIIQNSSTTTVMVVGFVNAGLMSLSQALEIIMGANIGTTVTVQLISFKFDQIAPIFVFMGTILVMFSKAKQRKEIGNIILGFGLLFMGMGIMSLSMQPISSSVIFNELLVAIDNNWFIGIILGLSITALLQSSVATTGMLMALSTTGSISINLAISILLGCNIGTCITTSLASIGTNKTAHKAAILHLIFNFAGTIIFIPFLNTLDDLVQNTSLDVTRQIANAHTIFNLVNAILLLPFSNYIIKLANKIIPGEDQIEKAGPKYIDDRVLEAPVIAVGQAIKETIRMANKAKHNVELSMKAFVSGDELLINKVYENEKIINLLDESITTYLVKLAKCDLSDKEKVLVASTFHIIIDIERIGDHAKNIVDLAVEKNTRKLKYSSDAINELYKIYNLVIEALNISINSYISKDASIARTITQVEAKINSYQKSYREKHIQRLYDGKCNAFAGAIFLDLITAFERIGDHSTNIAESVADIHLN